MDGSDDEPDAVRARYARRPADPWRYQRLNPAALWPAQERERAIAAGLRRRGWLDLAGRRLVEVGSGDGANLLAMLQLGFAPAHLTGIELLAERHVRARERLPAAVQLLHADAAGVDLAEASQDVVLQSTVFSSLLDDAFQQRLADAMWRWVKPGGAVLWYDFVFDNPRNADVRGVPPARLRALFPRGDVQYRRLTLAPPIARAAMRVHPGLYTALHAIVPLRTHVLAWIEKPER